MPRRFLVPLSVLTVILAAPGARTGWAGDAPWLSKGGSFDACLLRSNQSLNTERLANIGFGQYRGALDNEWDVRVGCVRTNLKTDQSGNVSNRVPKGRLRFTIATDWLDRASNEGEQGQVRFTEKKDTNLGIRFGSKRVKPPAGSNWTQFIQTNYQLGSMDLLLGWNATANRNAKANDLVVCGGYVYGFDPILKNSGEFAEARLIATLMAQAKAEIEALAQLERQER